MFYSTCTYIMRMLVAKALSSMRTSASWLEPLSLKNAINIKISCAGPKSFFVA